MLLQPELIDAYASALVNSVKDEPDGLGSISEARVKVCDFAVPSRERIGDPEQEKLLLLAMIEDLVRRDLAIREETEEGAQLVFPSQSTRVNKQLPDLRGKAVLFQFEGPVLNVYSTLAVRLSRSMMFRLKDIYKDAATYAIYDGSRCGIALNNRGEAQGELTLFFDPQISEENRYHFEEYVLTHLQRTALPSSIRRRRLFSCSNCSEEFNESTVEKCRRFGNSSLICPVCRQEVPLLDGKDRLEKPVTSMVADLDNEIERSREIDASKLVTEGKMATRKFDVFLCYNSEDRESVKQIAERLKQAGILPWLDVRNLRPGLPFQRGLEEQIRDIGAAAVFVGSSGVGPWQRMEIEAFLMQFVKRECPVIPVLLPNCPKHPELPIFLSGMHWVDLRTPDPNPIEQLIFGIKGDRGESLSRQPRSSQADG